MVQPSRRVLVSQNFSEPLIDKKIDGKSWLVKMKIRDYLQMVDIESNQYQRNLQNLSFYNKLINDLLDDTTMPPISVVYPENAIDFKEGLRIDKKFIILDGLQRTNCILECRDRIIKGKSNGIFRDLDSFYEKLIYVEIWEKVDLKYILYKMVVLNTGQKKMDYGHQLDILSDSVKEKLQEKNIAYITTKERISDGKKEGHFELSNITQALVSFINGSPIPSKKNAAEYLFERFNINMDEESSGISLITNDATYEYLEWVLVKFNALLNEKYKNDNPLEKYEIFIISLFASIGYCQKKDPINLSNKIRILEERFTKIDDPLDMKIFIHYYASFKTSIGDKRRRFIYETFRDFFLSSSAIDKLNWEYSYDRVN
ncbi:hypothetical protein P6709_11690 [Jeotgalibacillus sp. ET6]|uniref:hypothetical protein n=1 Tax=Jeotgalibacillus sp. ET6 TaxID=3037260 RepID=UPI002418391F|nr:hypothetical protein [Jeotgalibacillus sp. ET6]MDG5472407.1 hypothetical protein [Jeotgalibacillus sp. ET6]